MCQACLQKSKYHVKIAVNKYNIKIKRIVSRLRRVRHSIRTASYALSNMRRASMGDMLFGTASRSLKRITSKDGVDKEQTP